ncbi:MAG: EpsG family protein [Clostridia bacterium]|nr:EpsG family protein [Clostridia bacterium]
MEKRVLIYFLLVLLVIANIIAEKMLTKYAIIGSENRNGKRYSLFLDFLVGSKFLIVFAMIFLATFKAVGVGLDTVNYYNYYEELRTGQVVLFEFTSSSFEIGYVFLNSILAMLNLGFVFLQLAIALITAICFSFFIRNLSQDKGMSYFLFIALGTYAQSFSAYRQIVAMSLVAVAIVMIFKNKYLWFTLLTLLAFTFHSSAILCFSLIFFKFIKLNWKTILFFTALTVICFFGFKQIMYVLDMLFGVDYYQKYFANQTFLMQTSLLDILYTVSLCLIFGVLYIFRNRLKLDKSQTKQYDFLLLMFLMVPLIRIFGMALSYQTLVNRFTLYFFISLIILIPLFAQGTKGTKYYKFVVPAVYVIASGYMYYLYAVKLSCGVASYEFIWK